MRRLERPEFGALECFLFSCAAIPACAPDDARRLLEILQEVGGTFVRRGSRGPEAPWSAHPNPAQEIDCEGEFAYLDYSHPLLRRSLLEPRSLRPCSPTCSLRYRADSRTVILSQSARDDRPKNLDALARGQLALALALYPHLRPRFSFIDEVSDDLDEERVLHGPLKMAVRSHELPYLFWANMLAASYAQDVGCEFLLAAPGWKKTELDDGGILYVVTKSYARWWNRPPGHGWNVFTTRPGKVRRYFQTRLPDLVLYNTERLVAGAEDVPYSE